MNTKTEFTSLIESIGSKKFSEIFLNVLDIDPTDVPDPEEFILHEKDPQRKCSLYRNAYAAFQYNFIKDYMQEMSPEAIATGLAGPIIPTKILGEIRDACGKFDPAKGEFENREKYFDIYKIKREKPKRPFTAFMFFAKDNLSLEEENPNISKYDISKKLTSRWNELGEGRELYFDKARKDMERYEEERKIYKKEKIRREKLNNRWNELGEGREQYFDKARKDMEKYKEMRKMYENGK